MSNIVVKINKKNIILLSLFLTLFWKYIWLKKKKNILFEAYYYLKSIFHSMKHSENKKSIKKIPVGLLKIIVPTEFREQIMNDVLLENSVQHVQKKLFIYVSNPNDVSKEKTFTFIADIYNQLWDLACLNKNPMLDIRIIPGIKEVGYLTYEDLIMKPELNAIFGKDEDINIFDINQKRKNGIKCKHNVATETVTNSRCRGVSYFSLNISIEERINPSIRYFEEETYIHVQKHVILGGTFDHLHNGHKRLLSLAIGICEKQITIGVTNDSMLQSKSTSYLIESVQERKFAVRDFILSIRPDLVIKLETIYDPYGPAIHLADASAIVVSSETISGAYKINNIRKEKNLPLLDIFVCRRLEASNLSSSYIRSIEAATKYFWK